MMARAAAPAARADRQNESANTILFIETWENEDPFKDRR
jgi:quinol monooxygenase YgiN